MIDLSNDEIIKQLEARIEEMEANLDRNTQSVLLVLLNILQIKSNRKLFIL